jgi:iron complex outermembrane receptor protein
LHLSAAALSARFDSGFLACGAAPCTVPSVPVAAGSKLPGIPARTLFAEVKHRAPWAELGMQWRAQSAIPVNDANTDRAPGYARLDLSAARSVALGSCRGRLFLRVNNVLDKAYAGSVIVNEGNSRFFEPAPGVGAQVGIDLTL